MIRTPAGKGNGPGDAPGDTISSTTPTGVGVTVTDTDLLLTNQMVSNAPSTVNLGGDPLATLPLGSGAGGILQPTVFNSVSTPLTTSQTDYTLPSSSAASVVPPVSGAAGLRYTFPRVNTVQSTENNLGNANLYGPGAASLLSQALTDPASPKLPSFWTTSPTAWFAHVEARFRNAGVRSERVMFDGVVEALTEEVTLVVLDVINSSAASRNPYQDLKYALIQRHSRSESKRIEELLSGEEMGDRRPSEFYRYMHALAGTNGTITDNLLFELWIRRLPAMVQAVLKGNSSLDRNSLLNVADSVFEVHQQQNRSVFSAGVVAHKTEESRRLERVEGDISEIKKMFKEFGFGQGSGSRPRTRNRSRSASRRRNQNSSRGDNQNPPRGDQALCWYHWKHGENANNCREPCIHFAIFSKRSKN